MRLARSGSTARAAATAALAALAFAGVAGAGSPAVARLEAPVTLAGPAFAPRAWASGSASAVRLAAGDWWGGLYAARTGEAVTVYVSTSYPADDTVARQWADFFASLLHGPELTAVTAYVAPPGEIADLCGGAEALGCYRNQRLVTIGDSTAGVSPTAVAAHEFGHHVAHNRVNPPWRALDWGPKRWASHVGVCARTKAGAFFPANERRFYAQNPGEGFAEAYRLLNESRAGATTFSWPLVDQSFYPDAGAFGAIEDDVLRPWSAPTVSTLPGRFRARGPRVWRRTIPTPLDGDLSVALTLPPAATYELDLLAADGRVVLGRGLWSGAGRKSVRLTVCGHRSVTLRVTRRGAPGAFRAEVSRP
jgi:hypothetical protein